MDSQRNCAKYGIRVNTRPMFEIAAACAMPISGENSTNESGKGRFVSETASSAYFTERPPPFEYPAMKNGSDAPMRSRTWRAPTWLAATQSVQLTRLNAPGVVPWPGSRRPST